MVKKAKTFEASIDDTSASPKGPDISDVELPTIGRIVHVTIKVKEVSGHPPVPRENVYPAIVTGSHEEDWSVDVTVFSPIEPPFTMAHVQPPYPEDHPAHQGASWIWPERA